MDWGSLWVTGKLALVVTPLLVAFALPLACVLAWGRFTGKSLFEATCNLPLVLPPTVLGYYLLVVLGPHGVLGKLWGALGGERLVFSFSGLVIASMVFSLPFALQPLKTSLQRIDPRLFEAAYVLGCSRIGAFFKVVLPNSLGGIAAALVLVFAHTVGEFGVALMVGGSIPGSTRVASIAIFEHVESLEYSQANALSLVLLAVSYAVLLAIGRLNAAQGGRNGA